MALNENAKAWVAALRSGKYVQGKKRLCTGDAYCCLGVAAELAAESGVVTKVVREGETLFLPRDARASSFLGRYHIPPEVQSWLGLASDSGDFADGNLAHMNDYEDKTFTDIADIVESEPEGLFA